MGLEEMKRAREERGDLFKKMEEKYKVKQKRKRWEKVRKLRYKWMSK